MERQTTTMLRVGAWCVNSASGQISRNGETTRLEARTMRLLLCLADRAGEIVSIDDLLNRVWPDVIVSQDSVYQAVASLRRLLGDDSKQPTYIETVPRLGYRMVAIVTPWVDNSIASTGTATDAADAPKASRSGLRILLGSVVGVAVCVAVVTVLMVLYLIPGKFVKNNSSAPAAIAAQPQKSIAVLPFLDLTEGMKEEEFADGMTEELIDKLGKVPGFRVTPPTSSFYYKGKQIPVADIAKALGVTYVLDGSVRKSGARVRIAARLIHAESGDVVWSESYDRAWGDILVIQDDIADKLTKALKPSIEGGLGRDASQ